MKKLKLKKQKEESERTKTVLHPMRKQANPMLIVQAVFKTILIMTDMFEKQPSPVVSNYASSSGLSGDDKEIGYRDATLKHQYPLANNSAFHFSPIKIDLNFARMVMAEVVGTFILMFCVCGIIASTQFQNGAVGLLEYAATAGLTVVVIIFSTEPISCAHVNPAVTIAFAIIGQFPWFKVPIYIIAQTVGSVLATYIGSLVYGIKSDAMMTQPLQGCNSAFWVEVIATFIIMFLVAALTSESQSVGHLSGFVAGIAIGLAVLIAGPVSGGSMNPARSLGPAILSWKFKDIWIYIIAPIAGAVAGALMFHFLRIRDQPCSTLSSPNISDVGRPIPFCARSLGPMILLVEKNWSLFSERVEGFRQRYILRTKGISDDVYRKLPL